MTSLAHALSNIVIVLDEPKNVVNIAGVVRVMMNMGLSRLRLVNPDEFDEIRIDGIAHRSQAIIEATEHYEALREAVADASFVIGTSARARSAERNTNRPRTIAALAVERAREGTVAILFGREDRGLTNEGLDLCHELAIIPTDAENASLNLAQACLVMSYELRMAIGVPEESEPPPSGKRARATGPATQEEMEAMYAALEDGLGRINFWKARETAAVMRTLRTLLGRAEPSLREAKLIQAIGYEIGHYLDRTRTPEGGESS